MAAQVPIAYCIFLLEKEKDQLEQDSFHLGLVLHSNVPFKPDAALSTHRQFIKLFFFFTKVTSQIVSAVMEAQKIDFVEGDAIPVPGTEEKVVLPRKLTLAELTRLEKKILAEKNILIHWDLVPWNH